MGGMALFALGTHGIPLIIIGNIRWEIAYPSGAWMAITQIHFWYWLLAVASGY